MVQSTVMFGQMLVDIARSNHDDAIKRLASRRVTLLSLS